MKGFTDALAKQTIDKFKVLFFFVLGMVLAVPLTRAVWLDGFDSGADTMACIIAYYEADEDPAVLQTDSFCQRAHVAKESLAWKVFARKGESH